METCWLLLLIDASSFSSTWNSGYMAPEYVMHGRLSPKADVYSFGVVVLELISGQKNSSFIPILDAENLLEWVSS